MFGWIPPIAGFNTIESLGKPVYLSSNTLSHQIEIEEVTDDTEYFGVLLYDIHGMESPITWVEKPVE
ncbi:hypothetical protein K8T06_12510, partial [bacterium]|nr:hypothetical protein [bacterium]